jgi:serine/threonine protein kinase
MALTIGTKLGSLEVTALLGKGGMGEVYRARDTKLDRDVAVKTLPEDFADDPDRLSRFQREAQVLASLNHRNIAHIYGLEEANKTRCIVMELVEGETLQERLKRGPLDLLDALQIAIQIAEGLEAAHERGIVHRDLKPANIKITPDGDVKVLDFGLAKPFAGENAVASLSHSPTLMSGTMPGMILGTAAYMSPEQVKGKAADVRSDIWAFGCVLFEMLAGQQIFQGDSTVEILGAILRAEMDWTVLPKTTPPAIHALLKRCLQRDRKNRMRDIADARFQLQDVLNDPSGGKAAAAPTRKGRERLLWLALIIVLTAATALVVWNLRPAPAGFPAEARLQIVTPPTNNLTYFAISPDGRQVVFEAALGGKRQLWLRRLQSETPQPIAGTENPVSPFWSPDSRSVGFFADGKLKRIDTDGGVARIVADNLPTSCGGAWNEEGVILFSECSGPLYRVAASGGTPSEATRLEEARQVGHRYPQFLPDGRRFIFFVLGAADVRGIYAGSLDSKESRRLFDADSGAVFSPPNHVLFARRGALFAQRLDLEKMSPAGDASTVASQVVVNSTTAGDGALSASRAGLLAYRKGGAKRQLIWMDRSGKQSSFGDADTAELSDVRLSPDGRYIALSRIVNGNSDVWLIETARNVLRRLTTDADYDGVPVWSPDSNLVAFSSRRRGHRELYQRSLIGAGAETLLLDLGVNLASDATDWSTDGHFILYQVFGERGTDLWALPLDGDRKPFPVAQSSFDETNGRFSPDGRWIAFQSTETGRDEIYVQPFPGPGAKLQISSTGGSSPQWRRDGHELFYMGTGDHLMAAPIKLPMNGQHVEIGSPSILFTMRPGTQYEASPDGQRFLMNTLTEDAAPITVILNWTAMR